MKPVLPDTWVIFEKFEGKFYPVECHLKEESAKLTTVALASISGDTHLYEKFIPEYKLQELIDDIRHQLPNFHACWDWDRMWIWKGMPEMEACTCFKSPPPIPKEDVKEIKRLCTDKSLSNLGEENL